MNKERREAIEKIHTTLNDMQDEMAKIMRPLQERISTLITEIEEILGEEEEDHDNMPTDMQNSEHGEVSMNVIGALVGAMEALYTIQSSLDDICIDDDPLGEAIDHLAVWSGTTCDA